ncbi:MAG: hypothetical protein JWQ40_3210 [Segetibacter sp.]|nr:hypothetical protein [Segetibacter sp.]
MSTARKTNLFCQTTIFLSSKTHKIMRKVQYSNTVPGCKDYVIIAELKKTSAVLAVITFLLDMEPAFLPAPTPFLLRQLFRMPF